MAGIKQFIAQKIKHPSIRNKWIETMYMTEDANTQGQDIKIYWHGTPADDNVIEPRHLTQAVFDQISTIASNIAQNIANNLNFSNIQGTLNTSLDDAGKFIEGSSQLKEESIKAGHIGQGQIRAKHIGQNQIYGTHIIEGEIGASHFSTDLKKNLSPTVTKGVLDITGLGPKVS